MFSAWFIGLGTLGQIMFCVALPASIILIIQIIMSLIGFGEGIDSPDTPDDLPDDPTDITDLGDGLSDLQIFSLRSIIAFLVTFGWMGVSLLSTSLPDWAAVLIALGCGALMMVGVAYLMRAIYRIQSDGTADNKNAVGVSGTVYMRIPPLRSGSGKINVMLQGSMVERDAITDEEEMLPYGCEVVVVGVVGGTTLLVAKK